MSDRTLLERFVLELAELAGLPVDATWRRLRSALRQESLLRGAIARMEQRQSHDSFVRVGPDGTLMRVQDFENEVTAIALRSMLTIYEARAIAIKHGLSFAREVGRGEMVSRGMNCERTIAALTHEVSITVTDVEVGRPWVESYSERVPESLRRVGMQPSLSSPSGGGVDFGTEMRVDLPRGCCFTPAQAEALYRMAQPSPLAAKAMQRLGINARDEAAYVATKPCDRCRNYSPPPRTMRGDPSNPPLTCAIHPLGRPEGLCGDWEAFGSAVP